MARASEYRQEYLDQAVFLCEKFGATAEDLAKAFGKAVSTIHKWAKDHPEFSEAIKGAKLQHDNGSVVASLLMKATGFYKPVWKVVTGADKEPMTVQIWEYVEPDQRAIQMWLCNRDREHWTVPTSVLKVGGLAPASEEDEDFGEVCVEYGKLAERLLSQRHGTRLKTGRN
jgi:hypothetical protein